MGKTRFITSQILIGGNMYDFEDVVIAILDGYPKRRWPYDIIDLVFVAIEQNPVS
jgi:hypothetical protein